MTAEAVTIDVDAEVKEEAEEGMQLSEKVPVLPAAPSSLALRGAPPTPEDLQAKDLTFHRANAMEPTNLAELKTYIEMISPESDRKSFYQKTLQILTGYELGLTPGAALRGTFFFNNRVGLFAQPMTAIVRRSALCEYFHTKESTDKKCVIVTKRRDSSMETYAEYTIEEAARAGLVGKDNWKNYPVDMLWARCAARLCRREYPELILGLYTKEEMESIATSPRNVADAASIGSSYKAQELKIRCATAVTALRKLLGDEETKELLRQRRLTPNDTEQIEALLLEKQAERG